MNVRVVGADEAEEIFAVMPLAQQLTSTSPKFISLSTLAPYDAEILHLIASDSDGVLLSTLIEQPVPGTAWMDWSAPYNYGGVLCQGRTDPSRWTAIAEFAAGRGVIGEFHRFHPLSDAWLLRAQNCAVNRLAVLLPLSPDWTPQDTCTPGALSAIKKAHRLGVTIEERSLIGSTFGVRYRELMVAKGARESLLYSEDSLLRMGSDPRVTLFEARLEGEVIASAVVLLSGLVGEYHLAESNDVGRRSGGASFLVSGIAQSLSRLGFSSLFLGGGTDGDPVNGLFRFKSSFSRRTVPFRTGGTVYDPAFSRLPTVAKGRFLHYRDPEGE
jgi:hypothetical protein